MLSSVVAWILSGRGGGNIGSNSAGARIERAKGDVATDEPADEIDTTNTTIPSGISSVSLRGRDLTNTWSQL
jgi:hypothetical protein